jgi:hypothetical protein
MTAPNRPTIHGSEAARARSCKTKSPKAISSVERDEGLIAPPSAGGDNLLPSSLGSGGPVHGPPIPTFLWRSPSLHLTTRSVNSPLIAGNSKSDSHKANF